MTNNVLNINTKKILIVEDELIPAKLLQTILTRSGYTVLDIAKSGEAAIEIVKEKNPDLILMDIRLQGKTDGIEAMKIIREFSNTPVIYISGNSDPLTKKRAEETKFSSYISKPYENSEIIRIVNQHLGNK